MNEPHPRERRILFWMCALIGVNQLGFGAIIPVLPLYAESFGVSQAAIGATIAVYGLARFLTGVPSGQIADRLGRRWALALGGIVSALGNLWCALATNYVELLAARFIAGLGAGLTLTAGVIVLADITAPARRGRVMAMYQGTFVFAVGIGPFPGGFLAENLGLPAPFLAYAAASAVAAGVGWFAVEETRHHANAARGGGLEERPALLHQLRLLMGQVGFRLVSTISFMFALARTGAMFALVPLLAQDRLGLSATQIGSGLALGSVVGLTLTYPAGMLVDRYGRKSVIVPATIGTGASLCLFSVAAGFGWYLAACVIWGAMTAASGSAPAAYAADSAPPGMNAAAMSTYRTLSDAGYVIGPIALGLMADLTGPDAPLWLAGGLMIGSAVLFAAYAPETYRSRR